MCLILFAWDYHDRFKLVVAANRDEFYKRPTTPADFWTEHPHILAGKDLEAGGTWMGITKDGRFAAVTNFRDPANIKLEAPSRGQLTTDFLLSNLTPEEYLRKIQPKAHFYNGFNLLLSDLHHLFYYSNIENSIKNVKPGIYGLSNHFLDTGWPKVVKGKSLLEDLISNNNIEVESILNILDHREIADDQDLPSTGVPIELERSLSSMHINTEKYGTRCATVALIDKTDQVIYSERSFEKPSDKVHEQSFQFPIKLD